LSNTDYSFGEKLLHHLALGSNAIGRASFDIELQLAGSREHDISGPPVFISGLARAGTTILMRAFYQTGAFRSLTYRDMPFVLMPGLWKRLSQSSHKQQSLKERAHGDGVFVNFDSPEAFEEVFWRVFTGDEYIFPDHLSPHAVDGETISKFRLFIAQVLASADQLEQIRYLSKNNNNILRLGVIRRAFPDALILVPFRNPVQHAISLLHQHGTFSSMHADDKFTFHYMQWLGHHEFGATHRPFMFSNEAREFLPEDINYWLSVWINTYRYLLESAASDVHFVAFESLCAFPDKTLSHLFSCAGLPVDSRVPVEFIKPPRDKTAENIDEALLDEASRIYQSLSARI